MLTFREAGAADIPLLRGLAQRIWRECYPPLIGTAQVEYMLDRMYSVDALQRDLALGVHYEFASLQGEACGYLAWSLDTPAARVELHKLYLLPALHGRGLGQVMLGRVAELARAQGARVIQ